MVVFLVKPPCMCVCLNDDFCYLMNFCHAKHLSCQTLKQYCLIDDFVTLSTCLPSLRAVTVVGYSWGGSSASSYWLIKNSWGSGWGEGGYVKVAMSGDGVGPCGMYQVAMHPPSTFSKNLLMTTSKPLRYHRWIRSRVPVLPRVL